MSTLVLQLNILSYIPSHHGNFQKDGVNNAGGTTKLESVLREGFKS